jgi:protein KIBRA
MVDLTRQIQYFLPPATSEISLSSRSSLSATETPSSPLKAAEPMYENAQEALAAAAFYNDAMPSTSQSSLFDCSRLNQHLQDFAKQKPLSPIYEKALLDIPQTALSRSSSASNTVSVSAVSDESVAGDSGVFEASRASTQMKESAQIQVTLKYLNEEGALMITLERARNLTVLGLPPGCQLYIKAILLPSVASGNSVVLRTKTFNEFLKPIFGASVQIPISLNKVYTKSLQIKIMMLLSQKEDFIVSRHCNALV